MARNFPDRLYLNILISWGLWLGRFGTRYLGQCLIPPVKCRTVVLLYDILKQKHNHLYTILQIFLVFMSHETVSPRKLPVTGVTEEIYVVTLDCRV